MMGDRECDKVVRGDRGAGMGDEVGCGKKDAKEIKELVG
jgi:hypothetical protein